MHSADPAQQLDVLVMTPAPCCPAGSQQEESSVPLRPLQRPQNLHPALHPASPGYHQTALTFLPLPFSSTAANSTQQPLCVHGEMTQNETAEPPSGPAARQPRSAPWDGSVTGHTAGR